MIIREEKTEFSPADLSSEDLEQFQLAMGNQEWRLNNLYQVKNELGLAVRFKMRPVQKMLYDSRWYRNIILKARQLGFTTMICILALDYCLFNENFSAGINAHNLEDASSFFNDKIRFAYEHLPEWVKLMNPATQSAAKEMTFKSGSRIRVSTSLRSGTYQLVHISEFGKICAQFPKKAREIVTGTLNAVSRDCMVFIESTAEGKGGDFYRMVQKARSDKRLGKKLSKLDYRFFFFPWYHDPKYELEPDEVTISQKLSNYFNELRHHSGISLSLRKKAWYANKVAEQGMDMKREFPSTPDEAFEAAIRGAYYQNEIKMAETNGQFCKVPVDHNYPVHSVWDLGGAGGGNYTAIWFFQVIGREIRIVDFWQGHGYSMVQVIKKVIEKKMIDRGWKYGRHFAPHDIEVTDYSSYNPDTYEAMTRKQVAAEAGLYFEVTPRISFADGINAVKDIFSICWFDKEHCETGIDMLRQYQQEWDDQNAVFRDKPKKNEATDAADAFRYLAVNYKYHFSPIARQEPKSVEEYEDELDLLGI